jgi:predicted ATPase/DNA-binding NarL/FixJ family response regulator
VGRRDDLAALQRHLSGAIDGRGHCVLLTGEAGVGKSRLLAALVRDAESQGVIIAAGSAFAMEAGVPYGALAETLSRPLRALDAGTVTLLARGAEHDLRAVIPGLAGSQSTHARDGDADSGGKARLLWNVTQFLTRLATRKPLLIVLDNAHECDASSLELLHFLARQVATARILIVLGFPDSDGDNNSVLRGMVRSLATAREATVQRVEPLTRADLTELLQRSFALDDDQAYDHAAALWSHTRGNPFFVEESLKSLASAGRIRKAEARWIVDEALPATLPATVRDAVLSRLESLAPEALRLAEIAAILESRASLSLLEAVSGLEASVVADAIDALCGRRIFLEFRVDHAAEYEFAHPIIQSTVRSTLTAARERVLHTAVATALEAIHGPSVIRRAGELARHLVLGSERGSDARTLRYLAAAGRDALERRADAEAVRWLRDALQLAEESGDEAESAALLEEYATACMRTGDTVEATRCWQRALEGADARGDELARSRLLHHLAQEAARSGDASKGLALLEAAEQAAATLARTDLVVRIGVARAKMQQALGRHDHAIATVRATLGHAEALQDRALLARVHQTALQLYAWTGPASEARAHGALAIALAGESGDRQVEWAAHWAMAMLEGFTGDVASLERHMRAASVIAQELASPMLQAMTAEIEIEHASGVGRWDDALAIAERTIPLARAVMPQSLLPRLLVWTGLIVLSRDDTERAHALFQEAWLTSGADRIANDGTAVDQPIDNVHNVILAHTGMGTWFLSHGEWTRARDYGERGLALADRFGYVAWAIHRLIPMIIEASLRTEDYARVDALTTRLRDQSMALGHRLGIAWAAAADALVARVRDQRPDAAARLITAADELDAVPFVFHAARIRRNAAQVLQTDGDAAGAVRELRRAHDVFARLGAEFELRGVRNQLRSLGVRLPSRSVASGAGALSGREIEIARAVARRLTNKEIGVALDISARTVSTHLSNIFEKLGVDSRGALADAVRDHPQLNGS